MSTQRPEPLIPGKVPKYPFEVIAADLCTYREKEYLVVRDVLSNFPEVISLTSTTSTAIINHLKCIMARHGIPKVPRTDNGPQFSSKQFKEFTRKWDFAHITSSPHFPQSNGAAEIGVNIIKSIFKRNPEDPLLGLLHYRTTPTQLGPAPAQIAMSRLLNTTIPTTSTTLMPKIEDLELYKKKLRKRREKAKETYDKQHKAKELPELHAGRRLFLPDEKLHGTVTEKRKEPRSYTIPTEKGSELRKNRRAVIELPEQTVNLVPGTTPPPTPHPLPSSSPEPLTHIVSEQPDLELLINLPTAPSTDSDQIQQQSEPTEQQDYDQVSNSLLLPEMTPSTPTEESMVSAQTDERSTLSTPYETPEQSAHTSLESSPEKDRAVITTRSGRQVKPKKKCLCKDC